MRVNRWELNRGYRGKSSGRNDLRLIECVLRVFGNLGRRSDPESSILTIFARPRDFSKLPKTHARKGPRFQWLSELLRVPRQRAARLASATACSCLLFQWNDNPRPFVWTATVDSIQGEALAMSTNAGTDTTGLHFAAQKKQKAGSS